MMTLKLAVVPPLLMATRCGAPSGLEEEVFLYIRCGQSQALDFEPSPTRLRAASGESSFPSSLCPISHQVCPL